MSYIRSPEENPTLSKLDPACFLCGYDVDFPYVFWMGAHHVDLFLHPSCAASFILRLARDVHEHKARTGQDVSFTRP